MLYILYSTTEDRQSSSRKSGIHLTVNWGSEKNLPYPSKLKGIGTGTTSLWRHNNGVTLALNSSQFC